MTKAKTFEHLESFCTLLFAVAIFVWKPGIYVSSGLITLYVITRCALDRAYAQQLWASRVAVVTLALFALGIVTATIGAEQLKDITWMARKTLFLPVIVFFMFALNKPKNRTLAMAGLIGSFWIASLITLWEYGWRFDFGGRMEGTWPQGTWDTLLGLFLTFMIVQFRWFGSSGLQKTLYVLTILMALVMVLLAGGRAPWLGAMVCLAIYFVISKPSWRVLGGALAVLILVASLGATVFEQKSRVILDRVTSITDTTNNGSNWIRLKLWGIGVAHLSERLQNAPLEAIVGGGAKSYHQKQIEFFETLPYDPNDRVTLRDFGYPSGDTHNNYIDSALRHGLLWTAAAFLYLIWLCTGFSLTKTRTNPAPALLLLYLMVVGMFYNVVPHFVTFFFALFVTLTLTRSSQTMAIGSEC